MRVGAWSATRARASSGRLIAWRARCAQSSSAIRSSPSRSPTSSSTIPGAGEVRVRIAAAGVCHSDLHVRRGDWRVAAPLVMGHEGSGTVLAVGRGRHVGARGRSCDPLVGAELRPLPHLPRRPPVPVRALRRCAGCRAACSTTAPPACTAATSASTTTCRCPRSPRRRSCPSRGAIPVRADAPLDVLALVGCAVATGVGAVRRTAGVPAGAHGGRDRLRRRRPLGRPGRAARARGPRDRDRPRSRPGRACADASAPPMRSRPAAATWSSRCTS